MPRQNNYIYPLDKFVYMCIASIYACLRIVYNASVMIKIHQVH